MAPAERHPLSVKLSPHPSQAEVTALLTACGLPSDDIDPGILQDFYVAREDSNPVGVVGLQLFSGNALLRSLGVSQAARAHGLGTSLVRQAEQHAREHGAKQVYLLTNDAKAFFAKRGYAEVQRSVAPPEIRATSQFGSSCCSTAALMRKELKA